MSQGFPREPLLLSQISTKLSGCLEEFRLCFQKLPSKPGALIFVPNCAFALGGEVGRAACIFRLVCYTIPAGESRGEFQREANQSGTGVSVRQKAWAMATGCGEIPAVKVMPSALLHIAALPS